MVSSILWLLQGYLWFCDVNNRALLFGYWGKIMLTVWITVCLWYTKDCFRCCTCSCSFLDLKVALWTKQLCVQCQVFAHLCATKHPRHQLNLWPRTGCSILAPLSAWLLYFKCGQNYFQQINLTFSSASWAVFLQNMKVPSQRQFWGFIHLFYFI